MDFRIFLIFSLFSSSHTPGSLQINSIRSIQRWVRPTIIELNNRKNKYADKLPKLNKRSGFIDWNFDAETYSFGKRLGEEFNLDLLRQAFLQRSYVIEEELRMEKLGVEKTDVNLLDNRELAEKGLALAKKYVTAYLKYHLPKYPNEGVAAVRDYLLSTEKLAEISLKLGTKEIILAAEYPPSDESLATTLLAIIGALEQSQPENQLERPYNFIRDFLVTHLNQVDINEIWTLDEPFEYLKSVLAKENIKNIEPRVIGEVSNNYILAGYRIGLYDGESKKLLGTGFGDTYENGIETASIDVLSKHFQSYNHRQFDFTISPSKLFSG